MFIGYTRGGNRSSLDAVIGGTWSKRIESMGQGMDNRQ